MTTWCGGSLDFIHAFRKVSLAMLDRAQDVLCTVGRVESKNGTAIGLKVQATFNDPERKVQDQRDIEALMDRYGSRLDWNRIEELYDVFGLGNELARWLTSINRICPIDQKIPKTASRS
jgi:hypothetical protein